MKKIIRKFAIVVIFYFIPAVGASAQREVDILRMQNRELLRIVDSLQKVIASSGLDNSEIFFPWDNLVTDQDLATARKRLDDKATDQARQAALEQLIDFRLRVPYNSVVSRYIDYYCSSKAKAMKTICARYDQWAGYFTEVFTEYGIPEDITALCIVESAVTPTARSKAGAVGMWQLMPGTATQAGLQVSFFNDERLNVYKSTPVAAKYLSSMFKTFGDWRLAVLSYNCGPGNVQKAIKKAGSTNVWDIYPHLPKETQGYLPALIAVLYYLKTR